MPLVVGVGRRWRRRPPTSAPGRRGPWRSGTVRIAPQSWPTRSIGRVDPVELAEQPVDVVVLGGAEAGRPRVAEAGQRRGRWTGGRCGRRMPSQMAAVSGTPCTKTITARTLPPMARLPRWTPISTRALGRTLLARQHLLERTDLAPADAGGAPRGDAGPGAPRPVPRLCGRGSTASSPVDLEAALLDRSLVRMVAMRGTIHLLTRRRRARPPSRSSSRCSTARWPATPSTRPRSPGSTSRPVSAFARKLLVEPLPIPACGQALAERFPDHDPAALAFACRNTVPLVQAPPRGLWGAHAARSPTWPPSTGSARSSATTTIDDVALRYLRAFGPATVADFATWTRLTRLREVFERARAAAPHLEGRDTGASCSTSPTVRSPTRTFRHPSGSCPSTTTSCSPTPTAAGSPAGSRPACTRPTSTGIGHVLVDGRVQATWRLEQDRERDPASSRSPTPASAERRPDGGRGRGPAGRCRSSLTARRRRVALVRVASSPRT